MKKSISVIAAALLAASALTACQGNGADSTAASASAAVSEADKETKAEAEAEETKAEEEASAASGELKKIVVGASPAPHAEILRAAKDVLAQKGYELEILEYVDYIQPNLALESADLDANYFQHLPYLESFNAENNTKLVSAASVHYEPFGIYAGKASSLEELADGATVAVPNDTSNEARALLLLQDNGIITLKDGAGMEATKNDIAENPHNVEIIELEAAQVARVIEETSFVVLNGNYALQAGLNAQTDALAYETSDSEAAKTYVNVIVVKEGNEENAGVKALVEVLKSDEIETFIKDKYQGSVVPFN